ncbi:hypothetical protein MHU86_13390 [Fragilaria crotonensis]|nr:hypothetical protein MHU86_13390 [Fragilaria crotonensis]
MHRLTTHAGRPPYAEGRAWSWQGRGRNNFFDGRGRGRHFEGRGRGRGFSFDREGRGRSGRGRVSEGRGDHFDRNTSNEAPYRPDNWQGDGFVSRHDTPNEWQQPSRTEVMASYASIAGSDDAEPGEWREQDHGWNEAIEIRGRQNANDDGWSQGNSGINFASDNFNRDSSRNNNFAQPPPGSRDSHQREWQPKPVVSTYTTMADSSIAPQSTPMGAESQEEMQRHLPQRGPNSRDGPHKSGYDHETLRTMQVTVMR